MFWTRKSKAEHRYYLLPGMGRSNRRRHKQFLRWSIVVGLIASAAFAIRAGGSEGSGQSISQILPKLYQGSDPTGGFWDAVNSVKWILALAFAILALGLVLLYRARTPEGSR